MNTDYKIKEPVNLGRFMLMIIAFVKSVVECTFTRIQNNHIFFGSETFINWIANFAASTILKYPILEKAAYRQSRNAGAKG